jgi:hypothetical protein
VHLKLKRARGRVFVLGALCAAAVAAVATPVFAGAGGSPGSSSARELEKDADGRFEVMEGAQQESQARTAPGDSVPAAAFTSARSAASSLATVGGAWSEVTSKPYNNDSPDFPGTGDFSNSGAGWGYVTGRATALAVDGSSLYAGFADGGVWKSTNGGSTWRALTDTQPTLAMGSVDVLAGADLVNYNDATIYLASVVIHK